MASTVMTPRKASASRLYIYRTTVFKPAPPSRTVQLSRGAPRHCLCSGREIASLFSRTTLACWRVQGRGTVRNAQPLRALLRRQLQAITDPQLGEDMSRPRRVRLELLPEPADENPQILHFVRLRRPPDFAQQVFVGQHLAGMRDKMAEQLELLWREFYLGAGAGDVAADQIDREVARDEHRQFALRLKAVAQRGADARRQLGHPERLADVVVGPEVEGFDL